MRGRSSRRSSSSRAGTRRSARAGSHHELGGEEEVRLALHEAVERVEAALRRPAVLRAGLHGVEGRRVVPLAGHDRLVAGGAQRLGERRRVERDLAGVAGIARVVVGEPAGADRVRVHPGQQRGARRRAERMRRVVREAQPARRERIDVRGLDLRAVAAGVGPAHVVHVDDDDVRRTPRRGLARGIPRRRFLARAADLALELAHRACSSAYSNLIPASLTMRLTFSVSVRRCSANCGGVLARAARPSPLRRSRMSAAAAI